jgi:hypothetical protein
MVGRRGKKKSLVAIGHKILCASYHILTNKVPFEELGESFLLERKKKKKVEYLKRQLREMGYDVKSIQQVA